MREQASLATALAEAETAGSTWRKPWKIRKTMDLTRVFISRHPEGVLKFRETQPRRIFE